MTSLRWRLLTVFGFLCALALTGCAADGIGSDALPPITRSEDAQLATRDGGAVYVVDAERLPARRVDHVVDGDTLVVLDEGSRERVRSYGMAAPESDERCGPEATDRLTQLAGTQVRVLTDRRLADQFGRQLRYLFTPDGRSIEATLIQEGLARAWRDDGTFRGQFVALESAARAARRGCLWAAS